MEDDKKQNADTQTATENAQNEQKTENNHIQTCFFISPPGRNF